MGAETLDADLEGGALDNVPHCPITQPLPDLASLADTAEELAVFDAGHGLPGIEGVLDLEGDGRGTDPASLPHQVGQDPASFSHLQNLYLEGRELEPAQGAADQKSKMA